MRNMDTCTNFAIIKNNLQKEKNKTLVNKIQY